MRFVCVFTCFITLLSFTTFSQQLFINEVSQGTGAKEYVEFIVVGSPTCQTPVQCMDLRGIVIDDNNGEFAAGSGTGIATGAVRFANISFWSCIPQGTLILVYNNSDVNPAIPADDTSMSDGNCRLVIPINSNLLEGQGVSPSNSISGYPSTGWALGGGDWNQVAMSNTNDSFQIRSNTSSISAFHGVSWGNNNQNNHIYFSGSASGKVYLMNNANSNDPTLQANWVAGDVGVDETPGIANNAANDLWIGNMNPQCGLSNTIQITLTSTPTGCGTNCSGTANVVISGGTGPYTISWSNGAVTSSITNLCSGSYTVIVTDNAGCSATDQLIISNSGSSISVQTTPTNESCAEVCDGSITSAITGGNQPFTYLWSNGQTTTGISNLCPDLYSVTVTDVTGCSSSTSSTINPGSPITDPTIITSGPFTTSDSPIQFMANSTTGTWTADCSSCITSGGLFNPQNVLAGSYEICFETGIGACADIDCKTIIVTDGCSPQTTSADIAACPGTSVLVNGATVSNPGTYSNTFVDQNECDSTHIVFFSWYTVTSSNLNFVKCYGDSIEVNGVWYNESIQLSEDTFDSNSCPVTNTTTIHFEDCTIPEYSVFIPNTFTPNNDNVNDVFEIIISGGMLEKGFIMNRWGNEIHEFSPSNLTWNGETKYGNIVEDGVYTYVVQIRKYNGVPEQYHGFVTVIR